MDYTKLGSDEVIWVLLRAWDRMSPDLNDADGSVSAFANAFNYVWQRLDNDDPHAVVCPFFDPDECRRCGTPCCPQYDDVDHDDLSEGGNEDEV